MTFGVPVRCGVVRLLSIVYALHGILVGAGMQAREPVTLSRRGTSVTVLPTDVGLLRQG